jgi:hypothetical protein
MNRRRTSLLGLAFFVAVLTAACGGDERGLYALQPTRSCLEDADLRLTQRNVDFVASTALGGALRVRFRGNLLSLTFGNSEEEAERIERAYRRFAPRRFPIQDVLRREGNVVMLWGVSPTIDDLDTVLRCLRS